MQAETTMTEVCDECGSTVPSTGEMANDHHAESCSLWDISAKWQTQTRASTAIILQDGSYGGLAGATIFTVPSGFDWNMIGDERDVRDAIDNGELTIVAEIA